MIGSTHTKMRYFPPTIPASPVFPNAPAEEGRISESVERVLRGLGVRRVMMSLIIAQDWDRKKGQLCGGCDNV